MGIGSQWVAARWGVISGHKTVGVVSGHRCDQCMLALRQLRECSFLTTGGVVDLGGGVKIWTP